MIQRTRPDITTAQIVAIVGNVIAVAIAFGAHITKQQQDAILALVGGLGAFSSRATRTSAAAARRRPPFARRPRSTRRQ